MRLTKCINIFLFLIYIQHSYAFDTIFITSEFKNITVVSQCQVLKDSLKKLDIEDVVQDKFDKKFLGNKKNRINFGMQNSAYWIKLGIKNLTDENYYYLEISNPDINNIWIFELKNNKLIRTIKTGELERIKSRDVEHRFFIMNLNLEKDSTYIYYIRSYNKGEPNFLPINIIERNYFHHIDKRRDIFDWLIYGMLLFIVLFNGYLFIVNNDRVNLKYTLYLLFVTLFLFVADGHQLILDLPVISNYGKFIFPILGIFYLVSFSQLFLKSKDKWPTFNKVLNFIKILLISLFLFYLLPYPFNNVSNVLIQLISIFMGLTIIVLSIKSFDKSYLPSIYFLAAFFFFILGVSLNQLKEAGVLPSNFLVENSIRLGLLIESILLTISVLERFRISQEKDRRLILDQKEKLFDVNKELEKLSIVASETDNIVAIYNKNHELEWCNYAFEKLHDISIEETADKPLKLDYIYNLKQSAILNNLNNNKPVFFETNAIGKNGKEICLQTTLSPYTGKEGNLLKIIAIESDITQLKNYQKELTAAKEKAEESDRLKSAFLSNMSHEFRTPLNSILGFSDLLKNNRTSEKFEKYVELILTNGHHLHRLINDVLDISKLESGQMQVHATKEYVNKIIRDLYETYKHHEKFHKNNIALKIKPLHDDLEMHSDHGKIRQILENLLINAIKFTFEGSVEFGIELKPGKLYYFVKDTGIGISEEQKSKVFDRFWQSEQGLTRRYGGAGLGLSISKGLVDCLQGNIDLQSNPGEGSLFYFELPLRAVAK